MKIQDLAIIFVIIILPISLLLSEYTQFQIQTLKTQTAYDAKLTTATYDAIKAFQLNANNETYSDLANEELRDLTASVNSFRNSLMSTFKLNGYTEEELNNYIPALVYTLYDGFYIYSPYENENHRYIDSTTGETVTKETKDTGDVETDGNGDKLYGIKPYISYSCRYKKAAPDNIDVVITYALDNHITVQGMVDGKYVNKSGYLIDNIDTTVNPITYNGVKIEKEQLIEKVGNKYYKYIKYNGTKYYWDEINKTIFTISNGTIQIHAKESNNQVEYENKTNMIKNNDSAQQYYRAADEFTEWFKGTKLSDLTYGDAYDVIVANDGSSYNIEKMWNGNTTKIFEFNNSDTNFEKNIENESSNFNQHRLAVIRHKIETNLAIAISNYNNYSGATSNIFQMPELKEDEWDQIIHNISLISFLQGLPIGGKIYNGYTLVTNSESEEVVLEENIYILGRIDDGDGDETNDKKVYCRIGDKGLETGGKIKIDAGSYVSGDATRKVISAGRLNLDFIRNLITDDISTRYYYALGDYNASYDSVIMQNNVTTYDDIYKYVNNQSDSLKKAFYTALGRERMGKYNSTTFT